MSDNDNTKERRSSRSTRREMPARSTYERRAQKPTPGSTAQMRRVSESEMRSRTRTRDGKARTQRDSSTRSQGRVSRKDTTKDAARDMTRGKGRTARPQTPSVLTVPLLGAAIALVVAIILTALVTSLIMRPQVDTAKRELEAAQAQVETLTQQVSDLSVQLDAALNAAEPQTSEKAKLGGVKDPWVSAGTFTTGDTILDNEVKQFCDGNSLGVDDREDAALEVYKALAWADYVERDNAQEPAGPEWRNTYAHQYFENGNSGNCYEFAAALMYCLQYMGYEDAVAEAILIELQSGSWGDHGIVFVTDTDGNPRMCDTARGVDGWMIDVDTYNYTVEDVESD